MDIKTDGESRQENQVDQTLEKISTILDIEDPTERRQASETFITSRVKELEETSVTQHLSLLSKDPVKGFINSKSTIRRNFFVDPLHLDDPGVYQVLFETLSDFKAMPSWRDRPMRELAQYALLYAIGRYYGNQYATDGTEQENQMFYIDHVSADSQNISLHELKEKGIAVCAEKAPLAQNFLTFLGYRSELIFSTKCRLVNSEHEDVSGHVYNIVHGQNGLFIFDPSNPKLGMKDGRVGSVAPASYPISEEQYQSVLTGGQATVQHRDAAFDGTSYAPTDAVPRVYGGPNINL